MRRKFTLLIAALALLTMIVQPLKAVGQTRDYVELYSATFTEVPTHSYTQNKTFTLNDKSWTASVSQVNNGVFYLGCNSNNASKGILNNNSTFSAVVTALRAADNAYNSNYETAHAYALLFDNAYNDVTKVEFEWDGGNNAFQVYLFGDSGSGYVLLGHTDYATSGTTVSGNVVWTGDATNYTKFAIVARPGATGSTATNKTLRASNFYIYKTVSSLADSDLALTGAPISLSFDLYDNYGEQVISYTTSSTGTVSVSENDYVSTSVDEANKTITVTPTAVTPSTQTLTITQLADDNYKQGTATFTVNVANSTPATTTTINSSGITNNDINAGTAAGSLSATVTYDNSGTPTAISEATVTWESNNTGIATIDANGVVTLVGTGTVTFTASYAGVAHQYQGSSATYEMTVINSNSAIVTIWSEDFSSYSANDVPAGGTYNYVCTDGGSTTKIYEENSAGGTSPELLVSKSNGSFSATVPLLTSTYGYSGDLTLRFKSNNNSINVKTTTDGITVDGEASTGAGVSFSTLDTHVVTFIGTTVANADITIVFTATSGKNVRIDDIELTGLQTPLSIVATPVISPAGGPVVLGTEVTITCSTVGASIYYTTDDSTPTSSSTAYDPDNKPTITSNCTIKAIGIKGGLTDSDVASASYTIAEPCATPTFSVPSGAVAQGTTVEISTTTDGATIYYTTNGNDPTTSSTVYSSAITINSAMTLKAIAVKDGYATSAVASATYTMIDHAILPFYWAGGTAGALAGLSGVTTNGLGSDYAASHAPYRVRMDGEGDYIQVKTDVKPVKVIIGVKMIGGDTESKITVQESSDGSAFNDVQEMTISGNTNTVLSFETTNSFATDTRYVRIIKTVHGSNIGIGPIAIAKYASHQLVVNGYAGNTGGYRLIASPIDGVDPVAANMITDDLGSTATVETSYYDLYWFDQTQDAEWQNYRTSSFNLTSGMGYLYASRNQVTITFEGPYFGFDKVSLVKDNNADFGGWNLIGNPLGTTATLKDANSNSMTFYKMNELGTGIVVATGTIAPMEGVFVQAENDGDEVTFTPVNPDASNNNNSFSGISVNLAQEFSTRGGSQSSVIDRAIVRFGEGNTLPKFQLFEGSTKLYIPQGNKDYAVVRSEARGEMPVNFKAAENGTYTIDVEAENLEVNYLHLIDNLTGMDVDLLATPSYTFEARKSDIASRFRLVFDANTGNDETNDNFAFINNGELIVNGTGTVQVIDILGRQMFSHEVNSSFRLQNSEFAPGVYVLRLVNGNDVKTQKIVIK